ncbi:hypothetical protein AMJ86_00530 [bacterium SM23_57]|nr:MAG: hypothetical protein AMJ86_00530 [bacterium SM23_57]
MAVEKDKGSIIYKIIIVLLVVVLIGAIAIPKRMWDQENRNQKACRQRMSSLLAAEMLFLQHNDAYTDSLDGLIHFFQDSLGKYLLEFVKMDTFLNVRLINYFEKDTFVNAVIDTIKADTTLKDLRRSIEIQSHLAHSILRALSRKDSSMAVKIAEVMPGIVEPHEAAIAAFDSVTNNFADVDIYKYLLEDDSLTILVRTYTPDLTMVNYLPKIKLRQEYAQKVDSLYSEFLNELYKCPTVDKMYHIAVEGSVITYANIRCPLDSRDSMAVVKDWYRSTIGGQKIENHGKIVRGEKSWEKLY